MQKPIIHIMQIYIISLRKLLYYAETTSYLNNQLYHSIAHYIMNKVNVSLRSILYYVETTSFLNNSLYHTNTHYIM